MEPVVGAAAIQAGAQVGGGLLTMIGQKKREQRALDNQKQLMDLQMKNQMKLNLQGQQIQQETWEKTNYPAQMQMLKEAGLNPGLLYGKGGAGGVTGGQGGGSAASGNAPAPQMMPNMDIGNSVRTAAEIILAKAQARKTNAEANVIEGYGGGQAQSNINKTSAEAATEEQRRRLTEIQADIADIEKSYKSYLLEATINNIAQNTKNALQQHELTQAQFDDIVKETRERATGQAIQNELTNKKINLTETEIQQIRTSIVQKWTELGLKDREVSVSEKNQIVNKFEAEIRAEYPSIAQAAGGVLKKAVDALETVEKGFWNTISGGRVQIDNNEDRVKY